MVPQLASSSMITIEDGDSLPATWHRGWLPKVRTSGQCCIPGDAERGFAGINVGAKQGVVVVDANLGVGDLFEAWVELRSQSSFSTVFVGVTDDPAVRDFFLRSQVDKLATMHLDKKLVIPGAAPMEAELPASRMLQKPTLPQLNLLVAKDLIPTVPEQLTKADRMRARDLIVQDMPHMLMLSPECTM